MGCLSVSLWAREKGMGCPVCPVIAFRVQNKWRLVRAKLQMTLERTGPKENIDFKDLQLLTQQTGATFSLFLYIKPQHT